MSSVREQVEEAVRQTPHKLSYRFAILAAMYERKIPFDKLSIEGFRVRDTRIWNSVIDSEWQYPEGFFVENGEVYKNNKNGNRPKKPKKAVRISYCD